MSVSKKEIAFLEGFGARVREIRLKKGFTLEEMEERGWPSWRHLQKIEQGKNINLITFIRLAKVLDVHPSDLL